MISSMTGVLIYLSILTNIMGASDRAHAIYVSVLEIEQGKSAEQGVLRVKIFANDLEDAIFNHSLQRLSLLTKCDQSSTQISAYFKDHLQLNIDGKAQDYTYTSCEVNDISLWVTFTFNSPANWGEVALTADYLMELFPTQSNVVSITFHDEKRMFRLTKGATSETIRFNP
jgi:Domain of unknown function (DUF6702)